MEGGGGGCDEGESTEVRRDPAAGRLLTSNVYNIAASRAVLCINLQLGNNRRVNTGSVLKPPK